MKVLTLSQAVITFTQRRFDEDLKNAKKISRRSHSALTFAIFDTAYYKEKHPSELVDDSEISKKWYEEVCEITTRERCGLTSDSFGVVASSSYGDSNGVFPVYVGRDNHGDIVSIEIRFIG